MPLGIRSKCYRNTGTYNSPTWSEIDIINDFNLNITWDEVDSNSRESRVKRMVKTLLAVEATGNMRKKVGDANYIALLNAAYSDQAIDFLILDGAITEVGSEGWRFDGIVTSTSEDQGTGVALYRQISIKPTLSDNPIRAVYIAAGPTTQYATPGGDTTVFA